METNLTCQKVNFDFTNVFLPVVYAVVFIFGLLANCYGLRSMHVNWMKMGNINVFVLNLCVADILYILTLPFLLVYYVHEQTWIFGEAFCKITRFLFSINLYGSIGFLTCISVYRYLAIVHPLKVKGRITVHYSIGITALVWILVCVQSMPDLFFDKSPPIMNKTNVYGCFDTTMNESIENYLIYSIVRTVTGFAVPLVILVGCYGHVAFVLATKKDSGDIILKLKCLRLVVILAVLFSICFIPFNIFRNLNLQTRVWKMKGFCQKWYSNIYIANQISNALACLNSTINPLVYLFNSDKLLMSYFKFVKRPQSRPNSKTLLG